MPTSTEDAARSRRCAGLSIVAAWLIAAGCGGRDGRVPIHRAMGKVVIDGRPAVGVQVRLHPLDRPNDPNVLQPFAASGEDGAFRLGPYEKGDGAPAGRYRATLFWPDRPPAPPRRPTGSAAFTTTPRAPASR